MVNKVAFLFIIIIFSFSCKEKEYAASINFYRLFNNDSIKIELNDTYILDTILSTNYSTMFAYNESLTFYKIPTLKLYVNSRIFELDITKKGVTYFSVYQEEDSIYVNKSYELEKRYLY